MRRRCSKDLLGGTFFVLVGLVFALGAPQYGLGSANRMGAGFFPLALGLLTVLLGAIMIVNGLRRAERPEPVAIRSVIAVSASLSAFAILVNIAGLIPALAVAVGLAALGDRENHLRAILLLIVFCCVMAWLIFVVGLGSPASLFGK